MTRTPDNWRPAGSSEHAGWIPILAYVTALLKRVAYNGPKERPASAAELEGVRGVNEMLAGETPVGEDTLYWRTLRTALSLPVEDQHKIAIDLAANCGYELTGDAYSTPPSSDTAEGASEANCVNCGLTRKEHSINGAAYGICGKFEGAPPKPAPDTMRKLVQDAFTKHGHVNMKWPATAEIDGSHVDAFVAEISVAVSAPVPCHALKVNPPPPMPKISGSASSNGGGRG